MNTTDGPPPDAELLERARAGDAESFGLLFDRHHRRILRHSLRLVESAAAAEDVVGMVFLEAWRRREHVRIVDGSLLPWLLVTANNVVRNLNRSRRRHAAFLERLPLPSAQPDPSQEIVERLDQDQRDEQVRRALASMAETDQDVLTLCVLQEMPLSTAAAVLGIPAGTVKSRLHRAKTRLTCLIPHLRSVDDAALEGTS